MNPHEVANKIRTRLSELGSIDAIVWDQIDVDLHTTSTTHAKAGVRCLDKSIPELIRIDPRLGAIFEEAEKNDLEALPHGEHTVLIFN